MHDTSSTYREPLDTSTNLHELLTQLNNINIMKAFAEVNIEQRAMLGYAPMTNKAMQRVLNDIWPWIPRAIKYLASFPEEIPTLSDEKLHAMFAPNTTPCYGMAERLKIAVPKILEDNKIVTRVTTA